MPWAVVDTSVYVNRWEGTLSDDAFTALRTRFVVRQSSVVLSELRRGARTIAARKLVDELFRVSKLQWTPTAEDWWKAGLLVRRVGDAQTWDLRKRQEFQNDALIALSAQRHGAAVVTSNRKDFELLGAELKIPLVFV